MAEHRMEKLRGRDRSLTLVDVYDIAADIGKVNIKKFNYFEIIIVLNYFKNYFVYFQEFENIIDEEGADRVTSLMQKVKYFTLKIILK